MRYEFKKESWFTLVSFLSPLVVYILTLAPTIYTEDSAEFVTAAATLGIGHAPGYPLYVMMGKLFTWLPIATIVWRVNLLSAVAGALAVAMLYLIIKKLTSNKIIALASSQALAFSAVFWSQSVIAEVYTLNAFFSLLSLYWLLLWQESKKICYLYSIFFLLGLAAGNHQLILMLVPVYLIYIYFNRLDKKLKLRNFLILLGLLVVGLGIYLFLPLRSLMNPALDIGNPETLSSWFRHLARLHYNDWGLLTVSGSKWALFFSFCQNILEQFSWLAIMIGLLGLVFYRQRQISWLFLGIILCQSVSIILLRNLGWSETTAYIYRVYYLVVYAVVVIFIALGLDWLWQLLKTKLKFSLKSGVIIGSIILLWPASYLWSNWTTNDLSKKTLIADYFHQLLKELPAQAVLVAKHDGFVGDTETFSLGYMKLVENIRPDVIIINDAGVIRLPADFHYLDRAYENKSFLEQRIELLQYAYEYAKFKNLPLYTTFAVSEKLPLGQQLYSRSAGYSFAVFDKEEEALTYQNKDLFCYNVKTEKFSVLSEKYFLSYLHYLRAAACLEKGDQKAQQNNLLRAIDYDDRPFSIIYNDYVEYRSWWLKNKI